MSKLGEIISRNEERIRADWINHMASSVQRADIMSKVELQEQTRTLLGAIAKGASSDTPEDLSGSAWSGTREFLQDISASRARQGFTPSETVTFVLSLKQPLFMTIRQELAKNQDEMFEAIWGATLLLDKLGLLTSETFMATREELIMRQQQELLGAVHSRREALGWDSGTAHHRHA